MIYKLLVNAAFLAIGYYIGKEVSRNELVLKNPDGSTKSPDKAGDKRPPANTPRQSER